MGKVTAGGLEARTVYLWPSQWEQLEKWGSDPYEHPATAEAHRKGTARDNSASAVLRALVEHDTIGLQQSRDDWRRKATTLEEARRRQAEVIAALLRTAGAALAQVDPAALRSVAGELAAAAEGQPAPAPQPAGAPRVAGADGLPHQLGHTGGLPPGVATRLPAAGPLTRPHTTAEGDS